MRRSTFVLGLALVLSSAACTVVTQPSAPPAEETDASTPPETPAPIAPAALPFKPSNFDLSGIDASKLEDLTVTGRCDVSGEDTETPSFCNARRGAFAFKIVEQPNGSKIGVFFAKSIRVEPNASIEVKGTRGVVLVALDTFDVRGTIDASVSWDNKSPGGFWSLKNGSIDPFDGTGPSAGKAGTSNSGAGGGGHCGAGGKGGAVESSDTIAGGASSGNADIVPLVGGSSGGKGHLSAGSGGGAIQLVAGKSLIIAASGVVAANGGGGSNGGAVVQQPASGGGAGGAVLLESTKVSVLGKVTANGGAGGGNRERGQDGLSSDSPAESPYTSEGAAGGGGSAGETINGGDAIAVADRAGTGGGGAAGRIRVNGDSVELAGSLSPRIGPCAVQGSLKK